MANADREFFAAANSGNGFVSFYSDVFYRSEIKRRYLIKGGPGTGKSTFMKKMAQKASKKGYGVEYYRCSSDPTSLDGIIIGERMAFVDATSPHCLEAKIAGVEDEIVDLGAFWDSNALENDAVRIKELTRKKTECFERAYKFLHAAKQIEDIDRSISKKYINTNKIASAVQRIASRLPEGDNSHVFVGLCDSLGMKGRFRLNTYEKNAEKLYVIKDFCYSGAIFLGLLADLAKEKKQKVTVSYFPLNTKVLNAICFDDLKTAFVLDSADLSCEKKYEQVNDVVYINMKRFVENNALEWKKDKERIKENKLLINKITDLACRELSEAGKIHFELETIYKSKMNFSAQDDFFEELSKEAINRLGRYKK